MLKGKYTTGCDLYKSKFSTLIYPLKITIVWKKEKAFKERDKQMFSVRILCVNFSDSNRWSVYGFLISVRLPISPLHRRHRDHI